MLFGDSIESFFLDDTGNYRALFRSDRPLENPVKGSGGLGVR